jgi:hypothetical protein
MGLYYAKYGDPTAENITSEFHLDKENFESYLDESGATVISGEAWEAVAEEIDGRLENFLDELIPLIAQQFLAGEIAGEFSGGLTDD